MRHVEFIMFRFPRLQQQKKEKIGKRPSLCHPPTRDLSSDIQIAGADENALEMQTKTQHISDDDEDWFYNRNS